MSKVADYLQSHIIGEISVTDAVRASVSRDASVLKITPEIVAFPRVTNDIRKIARFAWQLADKGHVLPITARGAGSDTTGASLTKGISLVMPAHMNKIFEIEPKQKLVRLQPGVTMRSLNDVLQFHGLAVPSAPVSSMYSTVGGAIANNASGPLSGVYGLTGDWVHQLEIVMANGDVLQTGRISKRELNKKKGLQGMEGDIYRAVDAAIEDHKDLVAAMASGQYGNFGYALGQVKQKDGSFDLTPLYAGSQGTLGIISEIIMKSEFVTANYSLAALLCQSKEQARDLLDAMRKLEPTSLDYFDGDIFKNAAECGKKYHAFGEHGAPEALVLVGFYQFNERTRTKKLKKLRKALKNTDVVIVTSDDAEPEDLRSLYDAPYYQIMGYKNENAVPIVDGVGIPSDRLETFVEKLAAIGKKHKVDLPLYGRALEHVYTVRPRLDLHKVTDKQKLFKLLDDIHGLVDACDGTMIAMGGEGRTKTRFVRARAPKELLNVFADIKKACDPCGFLNPGVKQDIELKYLVDHMDSTYPASHLADKIL